jgi:hypothetical protein
MLELTSPPTPSPQAERGLSRPFAICCETDLGSYQDLKIATTLSCDAVIEVCLLYPYYGYAPYKVYAV